MKLSNFKFFEWKKKREKKFESLFYISSYIILFLSTFYFPPKKKQTISLIIWSSILSFIFYEKIIDRIFEQTTEKQFSTKTET